MIPMAIPSFGGMLIALITLFVVPVLFSWKKELQIKGTKQMKYILLIGFFIISFTSIKGQQLQSYIEEAQQNNPDIQAMEGRYAISKEKVNEANTLPNTQVSAGYFVSEPETRTGAQKARFSVSQQIPWFGTFSAREQYASSMAEADYIALTIAKRKLALSVSQSYYQLYALFEKEKILEKHITLLQTYEDLALNSVEVAKASAVDVLKLQMRQNELLQKKEIVHEKINTQQHTFTLLVNREETNKIVITDTLRIPSEPIDVSDREVISNPELLQYDAFSESVSFSEQLNQKQAQPALGFGLDYIPVAERPDLSFADNGKDIIMPMVSVSIPIFNSTYKSVSKQNQLKQQQLQAQKSAQENTLQTQLEHAKQQLHEAAITYHTQLKNIAQAKDAEEILLKNYETGTIDFNDVLDIQELQLDFQLQQIEAVRTYYQQLALINYITK